MYAQHSALKQLTMQVHYTYTEKLWTCLLHVTQWIWAGSLLISQYWQKLWAGPLHITEKLWASPLHILENLLEGQMLITITMGRSSSHSRNHWQVHYPNKCRGRPITPHRKNYGHVITEKIAMSRHTAHHGETMSRSISHHGETMSKATWIWILNMAHSD